MLPMLYSCSVNDYAVFAASNEYELTAYYAIEPTANVILLVKDIRTYI